MLNAGAPKIDNTFVIADTGPAIKTNTWYDIQVKVSVGDANGETVMRVNGIKVSELTGLTNNYDQDPNGEIGIRYLQIGPYLPCWNTQEFVTTV